MLTVLDVWCKERGIVLAYIQPGEPTQNAYVERLNGGLRRAPINAYVFRTLRAAARRRTQWLVGLATSRKSRPSELDVEGAIGNAVRLR